MHFVWYNGAFVDDMLSNRNENKLLALKKGYSTYMSFVQKVMGWGRACRSKENFCTYCECNGDDNDKLTTNGYKYKADIYDMYIHNGRIICPHRTFLGQEKVRRKNNELLPLLVNNYSQQSITPAKNWSGSCQLIVFLVLRTFPRRADLRRLK